MARATGRTLRAVAYAPFHVTLYEYLQILETERIDDIGTRFRSLNEASLMALAFHEPKKLDDAFHRARDDAGFLPSRETALARGQEIIDLVAKIDAQRAAAELSDGN